MNKKVILLLKIVGVLVATLTILVLAIIGFIHTDWVQQRALKQINVLLQETLHTEVEIGYARVSLFGDNILIRDAIIEDRQDRKMFEMKELSIDIDILNLIKHEIYVTNAKISGLNALLYKHATDSDSLSNYQFVIDAFKSHKKNKKDVKVSQEKSDKKKAQLTFDLENASLQDIHVKYNDSIDADLKGLTIKRNGPSKRIAIIKDLNTMFIQKTKKGPVDNYIRISHLEAVEQKGKKSITIDSLYFITDNHLPRKNAHKPKRGFFDAGHFDVAAKMVFQIDSISKNNLQARLTEAHINDRGSGLNITNLTCAISATKEEISLKKISINMPNTQLNFDSAAIQLPSKKAGRIFAFHTSTIQGKTLLKDIARPFAPVLKNFSIPVHFNTEMNGHAEGLYFNNIRVYTDNNKLNVHAKGYVTGLKNKYQLKVHFDVDRMTTSGAEAIRIINQFTVRKFMLKQLKALGGIYYKGYFEVLYKREQFFGTLGTTAGSLYAQVILDEKNKYVNGVVSTDSIALGKVMDMPHLGKVACKAGFRFDFSKPRTAQMRRRLGGKLPIGTINAEVKEAKYGIITARNTTATIESNGAIAEGKVTVKGKNIDLLCSFSFTNTDEMKKTKIKPGIRFHKSSDKDKKEKAARKAAKKAEKEAKKAAKKAEKEAKKAAKKAEKAAREAEKAAQNG